MMDPVPAPWYQDELEADWASLHEPADNRVGSRPAPDASSSGHASNRMQVSGDAAASLRSTVPEFADTVAMASTQFALGIGGKRDSEGSTDFSKQPLSRSMLEHVSPGFNNTSTITGGGHVWAPVSKEGTSLRLPVVVPQSPQLPSQGRIQGALATTVQSPVGISASMVPRPSKVHANEEQRNGQNYGPQLFGLNSGEIRTDRTGRPYEQWDGEFSSS
jgi:hypothetical protein